MSDHNKVTIRFVVNGEETVIEAPANAPLHVARDKALRETSNTSRPPEEWETRTEAGLVLDASAKVNDLGLVDGVRLFVNVRVAAGG